jgi:hypothetical protein
MKEILLNPAFQSIMGLVVGAIIVRILFMR